MSHREGGFFIVQNDIFKFGLKPRDIAVYCCICRHVNNHTEVAFPSRKKIAKECGIGKVDTVDAAIKVLCEKGLLVKHHGYRPDRGYKPNVYRITKLNESPDG